ncbi:protein BOLA4, chloroplastic/mitochondrial-like [Phoenix dactylifera]|uniref:Protein BOLA4, chloroplastic/mitochondrial-like n=1 Tax=Phoenix dactylifera TaxID=42345 RepID=A0A8B7CFB6_PHODC|nr:protein BOLA4, chloroplastic/mitochondrial-like [Phoenix dactylifera]
MRAEALVMRSSSCSLASLFRRCVAYPLPPSSSYSSSAVLPSVSASASVSFLRSGRISPPPHPAAARLEIRRDGPTRYGRATARRLCGVPAAHVSDSGSIDSPMMHSMENKIKEQLDADVVIVKDAYGDGRHVSIDVISKAFEGQSTVNRQRMVYKAIWEELQSTVHAVDQMTTRTPAEAAAEN